MTTDLTPTPLLPKWRVRETKFGRWDFTVQALSPAQALAVVRACGCTEPCTVTRTG